MQFVTDPEKLKNYVSEMRLWQGIPGIAVTGKGRIFSTFYSGMEGEKIGNYVLLLDSRDGGKTFGEPIAVVTPEDGHRCFDPAIWRDPLGRLWWIWQEFPQNRVYAAICDDPDADVLTFSEPRVIGVGVMINKPTVLSNGEWLFPMSNWAKGVLVVRDRDDDGEPSGAFVYATADEGKTFERRGCVVLPERSFDEHMILEQNDGSLTMFLRNPKGVATARSYDKGYTWGEYVPDAFAGPCSRSHVQRLPSGRILMINHVDFIERDHLTALLSEDDGKTWKYKLLLDERDKVSYPDAAVAPDGSILITYDRDRGGYEKSLEKALGCAREILFAKVREEDILAGKIVSPDSFTKRIISKLTAYRGTTDGMFLG